MTVITHVPRVTFKTRVRDESVPGSNPYRWQDLTSDDIFKGRKVVLFALPGAFTPTCSSNHLPRYEELNDEFRAHGVDEIICLSVNDAFVMFLTMETTASPISLRYPKRS
ncbi:redoxin family protein [Synechococcus lacustris]|uniref:redoxin family protein n=1 Tax=Synechococcus lacustris TaxID=2116544 RepID=UPI0020CC4441|nr:redoxin family protein [Synechococcus lacustris]